MNISTIVGAIASLSWLLVIGAIAITVLRASRGRGTKGGVTIVVIAVVLALALTTVSQGLVFIPPESRGVVISALQSGGVRQDALPSGLNWIVPYAENVITYSISRKSYTMSAVTGEGTVSGDDSVQARTSDGQIVFVDASVIYGIKPDEVVKVHINWQSSYEDGLIRPVSRGVIRDMISGYGIEEVYGEKRVEVEESITEEIQSKLDAEGFILIDFVLRNISFSDEYAASVEQKQIAEQLAQQAQFVVEQKRQEAEQARQTAQGAADSVAIAAEGQGRAVVIAAQAEAEARLIQAEAEAQALMMLAEAIKDNPDILTLQYINKLAPNITVMLLPSDNPFLFPLPEIGPPATTVTPTPTPIPTVEPTPTETAP
jgi:regulator of protease activity HflC (stomatin/prohibitin superfamily)